MFRTLQQSILIPDYLQHDCYSNIICISGVRRVASPSIAVWNIVCSSRVKRNDHRRTIACDSHLRVGPISWEPKRQLIQLGALSSGIIGARANLSTGFIAGKSRTSPAIRTDACLIPEWNAMPRGKIEGCSSRSAAHTSWQDNKARLASGVVSRPWRLWRQTREMLH